MANNRKYENPRVVADTKELLLRYKRENPTSETPMADCCPSEEDRERYIKAARSLKWRVVCSKGNVYENGIKVW